MPNSISIKSLVRSPFKTMITFFLLVVVSFFFAFNLTAHIEQHKTIMQVVNNTFGVLTVEISPPKKMANPRLGVFLLTDLSNPGATIGDVTYENCHHQALSEKIEKELEALPYIYTIDKRYMTAGICEDFFRLDNYQEYYGFQDRCILEGTVVINEPDAYWTMLNDIDESPETNNIDTHYEGIHDIYLTDVKLLSGNLNWLEKQLEAYHGKAKILVYAIKEEFIGKKGLHFQPNDRIPVVCTDYDVTLGEIESLIPGHRFVFVLRESPFTNPDDEESFLYNIGDDSRKNWWPYFLDITDLPENYLQTEGFANLRSLIEISDTDRHTFDIVYTDNMASIRRVTQEQLTVMQGRFLSTTDAGKNVCVVSETFLEKTGLHLGDSIDLKLGNVLMEQYAPLGAVAVTHGRYATEWTPARFIIVGSYRDASDGTWLERELYWAYSDNTIFIPSSFLPTTVRVEDHLFRPAEISFTVQANDILAFEKEVLPLLDELDLKYEFADRNWPSVAEKMNAAKTTSFVRLLVFSVATLLVIMLTVYLFLVCRRKEYAILRALGNPRRVAAKSLCLPLFLLAIIAVSIGTITAWLLSIQSRQDRMVILSNVFERAPQMTALGFIISTLGILCLVALLSILYLNMLGKKSPLSLLQDKEK